MAKMTLSSRAEETLKQETFIAPYFRQVRSNRYHPEDNPQGVADLGLAENKLCMEEWSKKLGSIALEPEDESLQFYGLTTGNLDFRKSMKIFLETRFHSKEELLVDNISITNGVTVLLEALSFAIAEPGDYVMVQAPYYYRIKNDLLERPSVQVLEVHLPFKENERNDLQYDQSIEVYESALRKAQSEGKNVKALLLVNPHNPTGDVLSRQQLKDMLDFAHRYGLHVIANEIYGLSVFHPDVKFTSILSVSHPDPEKVHFLWGFSKDFGLSGYRCGVLYTKHQKLNHYIKLTAIYIRPTGLIQQRLKLIIEDNEWLNVTFFPKMKRRLLERFQLYKTSLENLGVNVYRTSATGFIWADFAKYLPEKTFDSEKWLFDLFLKSGVFVLPGLACYSSVPGWFRIVASLDHDVNEKGLERLTKVLETIRK